MSDLVPILIVSYYFPPCGGAGTQRFAAFASYLPRFGYRPVIVAADLRHAPGTPAEDDSLLERVGSETAVYRVPSTPPLRLPLPRRLARRAGFGIDEEPWAARAAPVAIAAARDHRADVIITTVSPYAAAALGPVVRNACGIPWLLDLRDPWALDGWRRYGSSVHALCDRWRMRSTLLAADAVIANTAEAQRAFAALTGRRRALDMVPNGFDPADFPPLAAKSAARLGPRFRLVHTGTLHDPFLPPDRGFRLRHPPRRLDRAGRSGRYLFEAIAALGRDHPALLASLQVDLVGRVHRNHRRLARALGIERHLIEHGYRGHREALDLLRGSDAVFVPLHGVLEERPAIIVPAKLYEALASERFVLGCLPEGDAARLVRGTGGGTVCRPDDSGGIARCLRDLLMAWRRGTPRTGASRAALDDYTRPRLTQRLAARLDALRAERPCRSGRPRQLPAMAVERAARRAA